MKSLDGRGARASLPNINQIVPLFLGHDAKGKAASIGRPGLSAKQPERMLLQVVDRRSAEQRDGNEFGRQRRRAKDGSQCRLHFRAQARAHHEGNDQPCEVTTGDKHGADGQAPAKRVRQSRDPAHRGSFNLTRRERRRAHQSTPFEAIPTLAMAGQIEGSLYRPASRVDVIDRANESSPTHLPGPRPNPRLNLSVDARKTDTNEPPYPPSLSAGLTTISEVSR
jgi:hypothetical protein